MISTAALLERDRGSHTKQALRTQRADSSKIRPTVVLSSAA